MVDYGEAIKRPFSDVKKLLIGIVIQLIPIVNFMAIGYQLKCANAMEKSLNFQNGKSGEICLLRD